MDEILNTVGEIRDLGSLCGHHPNPEPPQDDIQHMRGRDAVTNSPALTAKTDMAPLVNPDYSR